MATFMEPDMTSRFLTHILNPVYRIAEDDSIRDPHIGKSSSPTFLPSFRSPGLLDELKNLTTELQELVQTKVGTTKFSTVYSRIRQNVTTLRRERKVSRARQVCDQLPPTTETEAVYYDRSPPTLLQLRSESWHEMWPRRIAGSENTNPSRELMVDEGLQLTNSVFAAKGLSNVEGLFDSIIEVVISPDYTPWALYQ